MTPHASETWRQKVMMRREGEEVFAVRVYEFAAKTSSQVKLVKAEVKRNTCRSNPPSLHVAYQPPQLPFVQVGTNPTLTVVMFRYLCHIFAPLGTKVDFLARFGRRRHCAKVLGGSCRV